MVAIALATTGAATLGTGIAPWLLVDWLGRHASTLVTVTGAWLIIAPVPLLLGAAVLRRTPWPWVAAVTAHLLAPTLLAARFPHLVPAWGWGALAVSIAVGLASVVTAFPEPHRGSGPAGRRAPGSR